MSYWKLYTEIDFSDLNFVKFNIDTRDFHCACQTKKDIEQEFEKFSAFEKSPEKFLHTQEELIEVIDKLYNESGGRGRWRFLQLDVKNKGVRNWSMKYIRIFRVDNGFVICNSENYALSKEVLSAKVDSEYLHHH